jgi:hypothetical protein
MTAGLRTAPFDASMICIVADEPSRLTRILFPVSLKAAKVPAGPCPRAMVP